jgi:hypothetical protein
MQPCIAVGNTLGILNGYSTPPVCIKCGAPSDGRPIKRNLYWHEGWVYALIVLGLLIYALVAICIRKTGTVYVFVCPEHRKSQAMKILTGWLTCLGLSWIGDLGRRAPDPRDDRPEHYRSLHRADCISHHQSAGQSFFD